MSLQTMEGREMFHRLGLRDCPSWEVIRGSASVSSATLKLRSHREIPIDGLPVTLPQWAANSK